MSCFNPKSDGFLIKTASGEISSHSLEASRPQRIPAVEGEGPAPQFMSDTQIVNASWDGAVEIIDLRAQRSLNSRTFAGDMIMALHRLKSGDGWIMLHDPQATTDGLPADPSYFSLWSGEQPAGTPSFIRHGLRFIRASALHPAGQTLAVVYGAPPDHLALVDAKDSTIRKTIRVEFGGTGSELVWSPNGELLAVVERDAVRVYDEQLLRVREFAVPYASSVAFAPNERALAIGSWKDGVLKSL